jgi:hypothetical protein
VFILFVLHELFDCVSMIDNITIWTTVPITVIMVLNSIYSITVLAINESNDLTVTECIGYFGNNCDSPCPKSYYGRSCQEPCNCTAEQYCNQYVGCLPRKAVHVTGTMTYTDNIIHRFIIRHVASPVIVTHDDTSA